MTPPAGASDPKEGFCSSCCDWFPWAELVGCGDCGETFCGDHQGEDHDCPGPEVEG
jgi:hypothetical protein